MFRPHEGSASPTTCVALSIWTFSSRQRKDLLELHVRTEIVSPFLTPRTLSTTHATLHSYLPSNLHPLDPFSDRDDFASSFVTEDIWVQDLERTVRAVLEVVSVGPA